MKKFAILVASILVVAFASVTANAANFKIGVVDIQKVVQQAPETNKYNTDLQAKFKPRQEKLLKLNSQLHNNQAKLSRDSSVMSAKDREALQGKIIEQQTELRHFAQNYQDDLSAARAKDMQQLFKNIERAVSKVAKSGKYDMILEKQAAPYVSSHYDVTSDVLKNLK